MFASKPGALSGSVQSAAWRTGLIYVDLIAAYSLATLAADGRQQGGLVRVGGAFQGGKTPDPSKPYHGSFVGR
ncbi:hypothetical protein [Pedomonas mirosovicensis]|uniref:hypothetical protein n=1 Tax=Pedomonas mirosovicensis TaxID=2908641 RepID=UPI0021688EBE|nr:hypothetical protein [Pedomonas mirosovicensis]MCH8686336.1 hypothetical protein [Pedomonas mirosovicensis]